MAIAEVEGFEEGDAQALRITRWARLEQLFHDTYGLLPESRDRYLEQACSDDAALRQEVEGLLSANAAVSNLLSSTLPLLREALARVEVEDRWLGQIVDGFKLESLLGRGGMGVVYLGRRVEGLLAQRAAVKVMAVHLQSGAALAAFQLERETLATLEHPHIARLVGGGVTGEGLPFVAMEYVEGKRLDQCSDEPGVSVERVVAWMLELCAAVSYVHRNLLLHRDLKPGNVMVDAEGTVKLLDFGALKVLGAQARQDSAMTQAGVRPVTLRYASPEHIRGQPGTTALDVYSLGMTLYRLLAGELPAMPETFVGAYLDALDKESFPPPSALAGARWKGPSQPLLADLDAITLRAIRVDPAARYESVDALADDLRRALKGLPVTARAGQWRYRVEGFLRRNRTVLAGALVACMVLGGGLVGMRRQAAIAEAATRRAQAGVEGERRLAHLLLFDYFDELKRIPGSTDAQRKAVAEALTYLDSLNPQDMTPELQLESVQAYTELGSLEGNPYEENLGDAAGAVQTLKKAVSLSERLLATRPNDLVYLQSATAARLALGRVYFGAGDPSNAARYLVPAVDASQRIAALPHMTSADLAQAASVVDMLGDVYDLDGAMTLKDRAAALRSYTKAQQIDAAGLLADASCSRCRRGVALEDWKIGMLTEDLASAKEHFADGLKTLAPFSPQDQASVRVRRIDTVLRQRLGEVSVKDGHVEEGLAMLEETRKRFLDAIAADPLDTRARYDLIGTDSSRADAFEQTGQTRLEEQADRELLETSEALVEKDATNVQWRVVRAMILLRDGRLLARTGRAGEHDRVCREAIMALMPLTERPDATPEMLRLTAESLVDGSALFPSDPKLAVTLTQRSIAATPHADAEQYVTLAEAERRAGAQREAEAAAQRAFALLGPAAKSMANLKLAARARQAIAETLPR